MDVGPDPLFLLSSLAVGCYLLCYETFPRQWLNRTLAKVVIPEQP